MCFHDSSINIWLYLAFLCSFLLPFFCFVSYLILIFYIHFRKILLEPESKLHEIIRSLDDDQREVLDVLYQYAVEFCLAKKSRSNPWPKPPLLMVHGGAGCGKTFLIQAVSQLLERIFRVPADDINAPYILKLAFTGNAAWIIQGQTIHSALQFPFSNKHVTLQDR